MLSNTIVITILPLHGPADTQMLSLIPCPFVGERLVSLEDWIVHPQSHHRKKLLSIRRLFAAKFLKGYRC